MLNDEVQVFKVCAVPPAFATSLLGTAADAQEGGGQMPLALRPAVPADPSVVPTELQLVPHWVCWQYQSGDPPRKVPVKAKGGRNASSTDPGTWDSFGAVVAALRSNPRYAGIGFVLSSDDPFTGIDLDGCIGEDGLPVPEAREIIQRFNSYSELSPSGKGVRIFVRGRKPVGAECKSRAIAGFTLTEVYDQERFLTVTGRHIVGTPTTVEERQEQLDEFCRRLWPAKPARPVSAPEAASGFTGDDEALVAKACAAKNGEFFKRLWSGDTSQFNGDESSADLSLCNRLAFWTGNDAQRMDRLFRRSGLLRPKWDERRGGTTYGEMTIECAIKGNLTTYSRSALGGAACSHNAGSPEVTDDDGLIPLGRRDPETGRLVLSPKRTLPTAQAYVREFNQHVDGPSLQAHAGLFLEWKDNRYAEVEDAAVRHRLQPWLHDALRYQLNRKTGELELVSFESNPSTVNQALESIKTLVHLPASTVAPSWLDAATGGPPAHELLPCRTLNLHIPTGDILLPTPSLFTTNSLDFDYDPQAGPPERWLNFLGEVFGDDFDSVSLLQEWFGYCLTCDTSQQKMLLMVGPRRSGKGTIGRIITQLVGRGNVVGPTIGSLAGPFGLQPLIGKSLAVVSDARFNGDSIGIVTERLLCISGEDTVTIDRKFMEAVSMKLPTRFMFLTNELPRLSDASTALPGRFLVLRLENSFYGKEDPTLTETLLSELPGILLWALDGWKRLNRRGRFVQPESGAESIQDLEDLASPIGAFVRECCVVAPGLRVPINDIYRAWQSWCEQEGRTFCTPKSSFGRDLKAAMPGLRRHRSTGMTRFYGGIGLKEGVA